MAAHILPSRCSHCQDDSRVFLPLKPSNHFVEVPVLPVGRLRVLHFIGVYRSLAHFCCACSCGGFAIASGTSLRRKEKRSCGCLSRERMHTRNTTHGMTYTRAFRTWKGMLDRCLNVHGKDFARYGGRGVTVCERWRSFEAFHADMGDPPQGLSLDRYPDNNGPYAPENCRWATVMEQSNNRRSNRLLTFNGATLSALQWARAKGITYATLLGRLNRGWDLDKALHTPVRPQTRRSFDA